MMRFVGFRALASMHNALTGLAHRRVRSTELSRSAPLPKSRIGFGLLVAYMLTACEQSSTPASMPQPDVSVPSIETTGNQLQQQLQQLAHLSFEQAEQEADALKDSVAQLLDDPNPFVLQAVREQWQRAYLSYCKTLMFSYLPTQDPAEWTKEGIDRHRLMNQVESWPIEGGYIDYVDGYPLTGIVNDLSLNLNRENLIAQHRFAAPESASLGFHVIEFLLWGEDGQRPASDYLLSNETRTQGQIDLHFDNKEKSLPAPVSGQNSKRRRQYLKLVTNILTDNIERMARRWQPVNGYYASLVAESSPAQVLSAGLLASGKLLTAAGKQLSAAEENAGSHTEPLFVQARIMSIQAWLLGTGNGGEAALQTGALNIVFQSQSDLIQAWQDAFIAMDNSVKGQAAINASTGKPKQTEGDEQQSPRTTPPSVTSAPSEAQTTVTDSEPGTPPYMQALARLESLLATTKEAMSLR